MAILRKMSDGEITIGQAYGLIDVGFWAYKHRHGDVVDGRTVNLPPCERNWPDPRTLGQDDLTDENRAKLVEYLKTGQVVCRYMGTSWCRFGCEEGPNLNMGSGDFTDGKYLWPEGLSHYVEAHRVKLPDDFVNHALGRTS